MSSGVCGSPQKNPVQVFFLLDDYASWLAQRESRIADLLGLCIEESAEGIRLHLAVVESKYVAAKLRPTPSAAHGRSWRP